MKRAKHSKILAIVLAITMVLTTVPTMVFAAEFQKADTEIYLNGLSGSDSNSGMDADNAVKTLEKAKELAGSDGLIYITETVMLLEKGTVDLSDVNIKRADGFDGTLIEVWRDTTLNLTNVTIDGNKASVKEAEGALVRVFENGVLNIYSGTKLCNNTYAAVYAAGNKESNIATVNMVDGEICENESSGEWVPGSTGNVCIDMYSVFNMSGGEIHSGYSLSNGAGIAIEAPSGKFYMSGGEIRDNECPDGGGGGVSNAGYAELTGGSIIDNYSRFGGGVSTIGIGTTVLDGTTISGNATNGNGAGAYLEGYNIINDPGECHFIMKSGSITGNVSENGSGGGIYGWAAEYPTVIEIQGGTISNNTAENGDGDAICLAGDYDYTKLELQGSPTIDGVVFLRDDDFDDIKVNVVGTFSPIHPVVLDDTSWEIGKVIVSYKSGLTPNRKDFSTRIQTYGYVVKGQNLERTMLQSVSFREKGISGSAGLYGRIYCVKGEVIDPSDIPEIAKTGYTITGWECGPDFEPWNMATDVVTGTLSLYPVWKLNVPTVSVTADKTTVHEGETITLTATLSHTAGNAITGYEYEWYKDGQKLVDVTAASNTLVVNESGSYTVKVKASDGALTSEAVESAPVVCTVTSHNVSTEWSFDENQHWHECTVEGCNKKFDVATHTGGTATCKDKAICTACKQGYGNLDTENHAGGTEVRNEKAATCTQDGYTGDTYCLGCNKKIADGTVIPANGHSFTNYVYNNDATYFADGTETAVCDADGCEETHTRTAQGSMLVDTTAPTGEIKVNENTWKSFLNTITFGTFCKDKYDVTITAEDKETGIKSIEYLLSDTVISEDAVASADGWQAYSAFNIENEGKYIIYAKITDQKDNVTYISSDGLVIDKTAPAVSGIEDGKTYCSAVEVTVSDEYLDGVTVNGEDATITDGKFTVEPKDGEQTIVVTDKAGNEVSHTITVNDGHTFTNYVSNNDATCTEDGTKTAKCDFCDAKDTITDTDSATGHSYDDSWKSDETNHWKECIACGDKAETAAHDFEWIIDKEATETEKGSKHEECSVCGYKKEAVEIPAAGKPGDNTTGSDNENPSKPSDPDAETPQTGDNSNLWIWIVLIAISAAGASSTLLISKKRGAHAKTR